MKFETLPGFRDFYPEDCKKRNYIFNCWRNVSNSFNFIEYDSPVLEPLELYIEKSGEEIVGQLFNFEDRGGRAVALRPELTPSLARLIGAKANSLKRPIKWFNIGENYRYERPQKGRLRAFYQFNADIFGEAGTGADAELISLLIQSLQCFGLGVDDFKLSLSDRDLWLLMLAAEGCDQRCSELVLGIIDKLGRMERSKIIDKLSTLIGDSAEDFLTRIEVATNIRDFKDLSNYIFSLPLNGTLREKAEARIENWDQLLRYLRAMGVEEYIQINLGIVRGLAYYTGFVFEAFELGSEGRALAGGGRYDSLVKKLGGPDMPAVGFAMGDVTLANLLEAKSLMPNYLHRPDFIFIIGGSEERNSALADSAQLRALGYQVEYAIVDLGIGKQFKAANQSGACFAFIYGSEEIDRGVIKVRDLSSGVECEISRKKLLEQAPILLKSGI